MHIILKCINPSIVLLASIKTMNQCICFIAKVRHRSVFQDLYFTYYFIFKNKTRPGDNDAAGLGVWSYAFYLGVWNE